MGKIVIILSIGFPLTVGRFLWRYFIFSAARAIEHEIRDNMFAHLETLDVEYYNEHKTGDLMTRFTSDLNVVRMAAGPAVIAAFDVIVMTVTANIDTETEILITQALENLMEGRMTIQHADKIIVMHKGEIRESGSIRSFCSLSGCIRSFMVCSLWMRSRTRTRA